MKKMILALGLSCSIANISHAQSSDYDITKITFEGNSPVYDKVVELGSDYTKDVLYSNAKVFFANTFRDSKEVIRLDDREGGQIMGKGNLPFVWHYMMDHESRESFSLEISVKDGRYRFRIYDVSLDQGLLNAYHREALKDKAPGANFYKSLYYVNELFIIQLKNAMAKKNGGAKSDW